MPDAVETPAPVRATAWSAVLSAVATASTVSSLTFGSETAPSKSLPAVNSGETVKPDTLHWLTWPAYTPSWFSVCS
ncbi:hypothetical protein SAMN05216226_109178 [Halovenus aranensis]|uniref:Uncharacterized protein n=1 Tax=Halovenus aranensis TaxID=890420 RepID=A0A1G8WS48_9EURY|nr:hypothetical protein SAMN05216226_109178 [Halovenus aranensis]